MTIRLAVEESADCPEGGAPSHHVALVIPSNFMGVELVQGSHVNRGLTLLKQ